MNNNLFFVTAIGLFAGVIGTVTGAALAFFSSKTNKKSISVIMEFAGGLMLSVVSFKLLPESFLLSSIYVSMFGLCIGVIFAIAIQDFIKYNEKSRFKQSGMLGTGIFIVIGIALHNLPEGLAIGSGYDASLNLGLALTLVIAFHDVPEGMALALPLRLGGYGFKKTLFIAFLSGLPTAVGAFLGFLVGGISKDIISFCLAFAGGAMLYIVCGDIIPESKQMYKGRLSAIGNIIGFIIGIVICVVFN